MNKVLLVILRSEDGSPPWVKVKPEDVPLFIKNGPKVVRRMIDGDMVQSKDNPDGWYRCEPVLAHMEPKEKTVQ